MITSSEPGGESCGIRVPFLKGRFLRSTDAVPVRLEHQEAKDEFHYEPAQRWATITTDRSNTLHERRGYKENVMTRTGRSQEETIAGAGLAGLSNLRFLVILRSPEGRRADSR
jgi:hypothetical protein